MGGQPGWAGYESQMALSGLINVLCFVDAAYASDWLLKRALSAFHGCMAACYECYDPVELGLQCAVCVCFSLRAAFISAVLCCRSSLCAVCALHRSNWKHPTVQSESLCGTRSPGLRGFYSTSSARDKMVLSVTAAAQSPPLLQQLRRPQRCLARVPSSTGRSQSQRAGHSSRRPAVTVQAIFRSSTSNPAILHGQLKSALAETGGFTGREGWNTEMTVVGTVNKAALLLVVSMAAAAGTWMQLFSGNAAAVMGTLGAAKACGVVGLLSVVVSMFKPNWAVVTAPTYALCKGVALAGMSAVLEMSYPGIAMNAVLLTFSTAASLLFAVKTRIIKVTDRFADTVRAVTGGYMVALLMVFLGSLVGLKLPGLFSGGPLAIGISLVAAGLAAANLLLDFDWIERMSSYRAVPKWVEWYAAQSSMLTLVWMYTEVLRLLWMLAGGRSEETV